MSIKLNIVRTTMTINKLSLKFLAIPFVCAFVYACAHEPTIQTGEDAKVTPGGLHKVDTGRKSSVAFVDPDANFSTYKNIALAPLDTKSINIVQPTRSATNRSNWVLTEADEELLAELYQANLRRYLEEQRPDSEGYKIVDSAAPDTLLIQASVISIAPTASKDDFRSRPTGRTRVITQGAGAITIGLIISDAQSGKALVKLVDKRQTWGRHRSNNRVTNRSDVNMLFASWGNRLRSSLDTLKTM